MLKQGLEPNTAGFTADGPEASPRWAPPKPEELAARFPELEILELIGRGGMGAVYKARQKNLERLVALKILPPEIGRDPAFAERFAREAQALAHLSHPHIVAIHDFGRRDGLFFFLMEYMDGLNLRQLMASGNVSPKEALAIVPQICDALQFAHDQGIVHRDIKPENILLDRRGQVKIADFGLAKLTGQPTAAATAEQVMGTTQYMAPEQTQHPSEVDHRADIYSLGVVFYQMLTGELPLGKFEPPSHKVLIDVRLDEVVLRALEKEPERRYQQVSQVKSAVETIVQNPPSDPEARVSGRAERTLVPRAVAVSRWTARILGTALLAFYGIFILGEGLPPIGSQPEGVQFGFAALGLMLLGFVVGWKREGTAAILICSGWTLWHISEGRLTMDLFHTPLPVGLLYGYCWWAMHGRRTSVVAGVAAALALAFGLGMLFLPTSVHVSGVVADASTGRPVADAELTLQPLRQPAPGATHIPNARSDQHGRFSLYVGWYAEGKQVAIAAPGYQALQTKLGPRPAGRRRLHRDFQLQPATTAADLDAKIAQLSKSGTTVEEVIHLLGEPQQYRWGKEVFTKDSLPTGYLLQYPRGLQVLVNLGVVVELRSEEPGPGFTWQGKLRLGSTLDEVLQVLGPPSGTVAGKPLTFDPGVLYKDVDGDKGRCYYSRPDQHIRLFFRGYRVCALYLTLMDELNANYKQQGPL
jgi:tRNA A-37 threonylcarbamoyl transferase component Bud32